MAKSTRLSTPIKMGKARLYCGASFVGSVHPHCRGETIVDSTSACPLFAPSLGSEPPVILQRQIPMRCPRDAPAKASEPVIIILARRRLFPNITSHPQPAPVGILSSPPGRTGAPTFNAGNVCVGCILWGFCLHALSRRRPLNRLQGHHLQRWQLKSASQGQ